MGTIARQMLLITILFVFLHRFLCFSIRTRLYVHRPVIQLRASQNSVLSLHGVGAQTQKHLLDAGISTKADILLHLPRKFLTFTLLHGPIEESMINTTITVVGKVKDIKKMRLFQVFTERSTGESLCVSIFRNTGIRALASQYSWIKLDSKILITGKVQRTPRGSGWQIFNPTQLEIVDDESMLPGTQVKTVYPTIKGISQRKMESFAKQSLDYISNTILDDWIHPDQKRNFLGLVDALKYVHDPPFDLEQPGLDKAIGRLAFDELVSLHLQRLLNITEVQTNTNTSTAYQFEGGNPLTRILLASLPFELTPSQKTATDEIFSDLASTQRMHRLLQGDVGSGKSIVSYLALLRVVECGSRSILLAPSQLLVQQHFRALKDIANIINEQSDNKKVVVEVLTSAISKSERDALINRANNGEIDILVGTHSLFSNDLKDAIKKFGLVIIDEEQKFGVQQRDSISQHTNMMLTTATPQPRSLSMFAHMFSVSVLNEKPPNRSRVNTSSILAENIPELLQELKEKMNSGDKIFWVAPCVNPNPALHPNNSAMERIEQLKDIFGDKVDVLHGKLSSEEKIARLDKFRSSETQLLVCTTVVETGIDIPDATVCIVDQAESFGLSQLHQIRGRIGRSTPKSPFESCHCILISYDQLKFSKLKVMMNNEDGFSIAHEDRRLRGGGDVFGVEQHGHIKYRVANAVSHFHLMASAMKTAKSILELSKCNDKVKSSANAMMSFYLGDDHIKV